MLGQPLYFSPSWNRVSFSRKSTAGCPRQVLRSAHQHLHTAWGAISHPPPPPVIEPSQMTGSASECQNCYPPKDEILVNENLVYIYIFFLSYYLHPKGEIRNFEGNTFLGGITGGGWGVGGIGDRGSLKEQTRRSQRQPRPMKAVNSWKEREAYGHDEGQNKECCT